MGWENVRAGGRSLWGEVSAVVPVNAAQLPAAGVLWWIWTATQDQYDTGYGGAFGVFCLMVFAPLLLPLLGLLVSVPLTLPASALARQALRRFAGPEWAWRLAGAVVTAVGWGAVTTVLWHWAFGTTVVVLAALGVLPALGVVYVRGRSWSSWGVWWRSALACAGLFALALGGGILATVTGLIEQYEPPRLTSARLAGVWRGADGAELRLDPGGRATARALPAEPPESHWTSGDVKDYVVCAGSGTWKSDADPFGTDRAGILLHLDDDCGLDTHWSVSGTESAPRLFALMGGDPDDATLRILDRAGG
ncbi:hypothetical protein [Streptomyces alanosinicus]|uniref:Uncharacterized protein n=1 Tax=Streptomyces alanosinicus TaxID=68171 RepID=A0A918YEG6_9ACTN|nr:hypothetical protein [Streptomyces alanosinicus]GHE00362.1 hypothetical protein GCM10010339_15230 [Streptomyces alanosinicus]